jgi:hypothetical protein
MGLGLEVDDEGGDVNVDVHVDVDTPLSSEEEVVEGNLLRTVNVPVLSEFSWDGDAEKDVGGMWEA